MRHAILGVGGVGGLIGAALAKVGEEVTVVVRREALKDYPPELSLQSPFGNFSVPVERVAAVTQSFDVLWIATKATHLEVALQAIPKPELIGAIVPLLNGIDHVALLRARFGHDRVVPASIGVESERVAPGKIIHRSPGARLTVSATGESRLGSTLDKLRQFGFQCQFSSDEPRILWSKLVILAPCALATTASGLTVGEVSKDPVWRKRIDACVREVCSVATVLGTPLDPDVFLPFFDKMPAVSRTSMQKDFEAGNPLELDAVAVPILRGAQQHGLNVPATRELADMVRGKAAAAARR